MTCLRETKRVFVECVWDADARLFTEHTGIKYYTRPEALLFGRCRLRCGGRSCGFFGGKGERHRELQMNDDGDGGTTESHTQAR